MTQPATLDLRCVRASTTAFNFHIENPRDTALDLADYDAATFTVKQSWGAAEALFQKTLGVGIEFTTPTNGDLVVTIAVEDTEEIEIDTYKDSENLVCDLDLTHSDGSKYTVARGRFVLLKEV